MTAESPDALPCVEPREGGVAVSVKARPSAGRTRVTGFDGSRGELAVDVSAPPEGGRANKELARYLRKLLGAESVAILAGASDRHKVLFAKGVSEEAAVAAIRGELDDR